MSKLKLSKETTSVKIEVTQDAIDCGAPGEADACPIACAFMDQVDEILSISVGLRTVWLKFHDETILTFDTPERAQQFIRDFDYDDTRDEAKPTAFTFRRKSG